MEKFEKVEKIISKTGVTYEEAKEALDACGEDLLDRWEKENPEVLQESISP